MSKQQTGKGSKIPGYTTPAGTEEKYPRRRRIRAGDQVTDKDQKQSDGKSDSSTLEETEYKPAPDDCPGITGFGLSAVVMGLILPEFHDRITIIII